jgi:hypothetical protein
MLTHRIGLRGGPSTDEGLILISRNLLLELILLTSQLAIVRRREDGVCLELGCLGGIAEPLVDLSQLPIEVSFALLEGCLDFGECLHKVNIIIDASEREREKERERERESVCEYAS